MSAKAKSVSHGGFWNSGKNSYSPGTQQLLKEMMQESKLTSYQQRKLQQTVQNGDALPLRFSQNNGKSEKQDFNLRKKNASRKALNARLLDGGKRTRDTIEAMGAYDQATYRPHPGRRCYDKEKQKLANIMAFGKDMEPMQIRKPRPKVQEPDEDIDRFDELQNEIEERHAFLQEMESLGNGKKYRTIIQTEISQKIREMEIIDRERSVELEELRKEKEKEKGLQTETKSPIPEDPIES